MNAPSRETFGEVRKEYLDLPCTFWESRTLHCILDFHLFPERRRAVRGFLAYGLRIQSYV